ncbi:MAG: helix-turn-helix domain-containing protein [Intrasporangium sp.]|uniref:helix-turn-helix transcriptional regulator n=1 Tax=Intrasporangium sp. TaxID=1925024 RepID=UPI0026479ECC|nr:helix-turn-helix transcriptional regulator [Intrasporangium sp.]MDN5794498.1 helix-turn-helix domain-containing protein [Intrasporangium sp.]
MARIRVSARRGAADAAAVLGQQIKAARIARTWTAVELAERIGVDRRTVAAIEAGDPGVSLGNVFNAADIVGVPLFGAEDHAALARLRREGRDRLALLPTRVGKPRRKSEPDDDF